MLSAFQDHKGQVRNLSFVTFCNIYPLLATYKVFPMLTTHNKGQIWLTYIQLTMGNNNTNAKSILRRLHYIEKWRKGANLLMPKPSDISLAIDDAIRYIRSNEKYKDVPLTPDILLTNGYRANTDGMVLNECYTQYISGDGLIIVSTNLSHTPGRDWYVSVDDVDMNSIGGMDCGTVYHFNSLLDLCDYKGARLTIQDKISRPISR